MPSSNKPPQTLLTKVCGGLFSAVSRQLRLEVREDCLKIFSGLLIDVGLSTAIFSKKTYGSPKAVRRSSIKNSCGVIGPREIKTEVED
ncbi:hypothetical protein TNIN_67701 [Trichonephila inaurata madagascariensis]|uniref:Uncharacterized protein n=1 Tax=Trichonephila inaurata madagascariensis TaxID=2747483 RepID=A0A8X6MES4_9ARAC|nr:hypothetical protein TNIN_67701 [Trichonephila inaurata madagascariensis]